MTDNYVPHSGAIMQLDESASSMASAASLACAYQRGLATPDEVVATCIARAQASNSVFTTITVERAVTEARASTKRWQRGTRLSPLDGIPVSWKDLFDVAGTPTTAGSAILRGAPPASEDAPLVARAAAAGMICIGKTNLSEFAYSGLGLNPHFGTPTNPALGGNKYAPGGSSSGAAIAITQHIVPLSIGSDSAGSIRIPASFNGIVGYRASCDRYDMRGVFALAPTLDTVGLLANTVEDCIAMDRVFSSVAPQSPADSHVDLSSECFAVDCSILYNDIVSEVVRKNLKLALDRLRARGAQIVERDLGSLRRVYALIESHGWLGSYEAFAMHQSVLDTPAAAQLDRRVRERLEAARHNSAARYLQILWQRRTLLETIRAELAGATLILPTTAHCAPLLAQLEVDDEFFAAVNLKTLWATMPGSFLDMPSVALPTGIDEFGLPTSMQLLRTQGDDEQLLVVASAVQCELQ